MTSSTRHFLIAWFQFFLMLAPVDFPLPLSSSQPPSLPPSFPPYFKGERNFSSVLKESAKELESARNVIWNFKSFTRQSKNLEESPQESIKDLKNLQESLRKSQKVPKNLQRIPENLPKSSKIFQNPRKSTKNLQRIPENLPKSPKIYKESSRIPKNSPKG